MKFPNPLTEVNVWSKIEVLKNSAHEMLLDPKGFEVPDTPGRDVRVLDLKNHPPKKGFSHVEGRARLLHDLASIELQAMELGVRSLLEYPDAPKDFREQLLNVTLDESRHLTLCLQGLGGLGYEFGAFPVHTVLWDCVDSSDDLLDRILIVHRYLEGSGLDASDLILRRLTGVEDKTVRNVVKVIADEEVGHVQFGSDWFRKMAQLQKRDANSEFVVRLNHLRRRLPRRLDLIVESVRKEAGFNDVELDALGALKEYFAAGIEEAHQPLRSIGVSKSLRANAPNV